MGGLHGLDLPLHYMACMGGRPAWPGAVHYKDQYTPAVGLQKSLLDEDTKIMLHRLAAGLTVHGETQRATSRRAVVETPRLFHLAGGDNTAEALVGSVKSCLRRQNLLRSGTDEQITVNTLCASFLQENPGLFTVLKALAAYRQYCKAVLPPRAASSNTDWLKFAG